MAAQWNSKSVGNKMMPWTWSPLHSVGLAPFLPISGGLSAPQIGLCVGRCDPALHTQDSSVKVRRAVHHVYQGPSDGKWCRRSREGDRASPSGVSGQLLCLKNPHATMSQRIHNTAGTPTLFKNKEQNSFRNYEGER